MRTGRPRDPNSIDSKGRVVIAVDRPCREDLKAQAAAKGITLVEHLRELANTAAAQPVQMKGLTIAPGVPASQSNHALMRIIDNLSNALAVKIADSIQFIGDTDKDIEKYMKVLTWAINAEYAESRLAGAKELLRIKQEQVAQREQLPLQLQPEKGVAL